MNYKITTLVENCVYGRKLQAEHGLSLYIETAYSLIQVHRICSFAMPVCFTSTCGK